MIPIERPENELLICLARPTVDVAKTERVRRLVRGGLDWDYLLAMADRHNVIPRFYYHLNAICPETVPDQALFKLQDHNQENTRRSLFLTGELLKLLELLEAQGIRAVPFKGPTLAWCAYGDVALRQFGDLDILVHKQDVLKVRELLVDEGFNPTPELTSAQEAALLRFDCAYNFSNDKNVMFDVHWNFAAPYFSLAVDVQGVWDRLETITISGKQLQTLSTEDLISVLCLHGFTHLWERLGWTCDVAGLIDRQRNINWQVLLNNAVRQGSRRILSLGLLLASELLEAPLPLDVLQTAKADPEVRTLAEQVQRRLFATGPAPSGLLAGTSLQLRMRERKRDKLTSCLRLAAAPRVYDWMLMPLPARLFLLYYLLRAIRLAARYGAKLLNGSLTEQIPQ